ncbi:peptide transporter [Candidatus Woesearchaeota archaeon CG10_big_fil_rev_8_21_14_0_10_45_16]|nr:MAG: peptide transporter [Candidatus Woesearchaeota archaeon CG10_big_fil_rev_8_21_14_0_10_45_16]
MSFQNIGVDIEKVSRFKEKLDDDHFLSLLFTPRELTYCRSKVDPAIHLTGKFCVKEAVLKAISRNISSKIPLLDIEVINDATGRPSVFIKGEERKDILCSISHTDENAMAFVVVIN